MARHALFDDTSHYGRLAAEEPREKLFYKFFERHNIEVRERFAKGEGVELRACAATSQDAWENAEVRLASGQVCSETKVFLSGNDDVGQLDRARGVFNIWVEGIPPIPAKAHAYLITPDSLKRLRAAGGLKGEATKDVIDALVSDAFLQTNLALAHELSVIPRLEAQVSVAKQHGAAELHFRGEIPQQSFAPEPDTLIVVVLDYSPGVYGLAISPDGRMVAAGSGNGAILTQSLVGEDDLTFVKPIASARTKVTTIAFSFDGKLIAAGSDDGNIYMCNLQGQVTSQLEGHFGSVNSVTFTPDGRFLLTGSSDKSLRLWDVANGQEVRRFEVAGSEVAHLDTVTCTAISPDGRQLLSGSYDHTIRLWDVATGQQLRTFVGHTDWVNSVCFSPDGRQVLSGSSDRIIRLWDVATGQQVRVFDGHTNSVNSVCFSSDGRLVLSGSDDKTIRSWDTANGQQVGTFEGHTGRITSVCISPDGRQVLSGSDDNTIRLWDMISRNVNGVDREVTVRDLNYNEVKCLPSSPSKCAPTAILEDHSNLQDRILIIERVKSLSPREREVMLRMVRGATTRHIAETLNISIKTVESHRARIMGKMQADGISELVHMVEQIDASVL